MGLWGQTDCRWANATRTLPSASASASGMGAVVAPAVGWHITHYRGPKALECQCFAEGEPAARKSLQNGGVEPVDAEIGG